MASATTVALANGGAGQYDHSRVKHFIGELAVSSGSPQPWYLSSEIEDGLGDELSWSLCDELQASLASSAGVSVSRTRSSTT
jgi:hypothetical protein